MKTIIFVYNADSGLATQVKDLFIKVTSPEEYDCNLCMVTYGLASMKPEWKSFLESIPFEKEFLHKNEFQRKFPEFIDTPLPAIFINDGSLAVLVSHEEINEQKDLNGMISLLTSKLDAKTN